MKRKLILLGIALLAALSLSGTTEAQYPPLSQATLWNCSLDDIGATLTRCAVADTTGPFAMYITTIIGQSTTSTGGLFLLRLGTGTNCGTGTVSVLPSAASVPRLAYPANTSPPTVMQLMTPLRVPQGKDLCLIGTATQTFTGQISGFYGS